MVKAFSSLADDIAADEDEIGEMEDGKLWLDLR
jgi:hypothetical protein